ncbi:hypothetical protein [Streptomyces sp. DH37]|nr:hypothetical protein [Streptomyces sp. DH37]MDG9702052.1 hypothetical protein [Streptomyces sp. DH37]
MRDTGDEGGAEGRARELTRKPAGTLAAEGDLTVRGARQWA